MGTTRTVKKYVIKYGMLRSLYGSDEKSLNILQLLNIPKVKVQKSFHKKTLFAIQEVKIKWLTWFGERVSWNLVLQRKSSGNFSFPAWSMSMRAKNKVLVCHSESGDSSAQNKNDTSQTKKSHYRNWAGQWRGWNGGSLYPTVSKVIPQSE